MIDIFLSHAWRFHDDWNPFVELLDATENLEWRNFGLPWYDPVWDPNTPIGKKVVYEVLENQVSPAQIMFLFTRNFESKRARKWINFEIDVARRNKIPIIAIPKYGENDIPDEVSALADFTVGWDGKAILELIQETVSQ